MSIKSYIFGFFIFAISSINAQKKSISTQFTSDKIIVDANFEEPCWKNASLAKDFVMWNPDNGKPEKKEQRTEVKVVYNNDAIFFSAMLFDDNPSKIMKEITDRDKPNGTADKFGVLLNGFNDGQQEFVFIVSAAGVQEDNVYTDIEGEEDYSWNAIWESSVKITEKGWQVEMKIPYAALRFSSDKKQTWGVNFYREFRRERQYYTWSLIDAKIPTRCNQAGIIEGIENIKPPTRLFFIPYSSFYTSASAQQKTKGELKGGMDIKYGINDAFTLDAILVPDFGQTIFDNVQLNLGPFEQQFQENRPFFTEGTDLFNKGNLLYTRRIGGSPSISESDIKLENNEEVLNYESKVNLLNALKVSGRTKGGLGIGILNAITNNTYAQIINKETGQTRVALTEPLANYNVVSFDQRFRKNSSVSFINTNVLRNGNFRDANVSALVFDTYDKKNRYNFSGNYKYSFVNQLDDKDLKGYSSNLYFAKSDGKLRYGTGLIYVSRGYNIDDLGINFFSHYHGFNTNTSYRILNPTKTFNSLDLGLYTNYEFDNRTGRIQRANTAIRFNASNKKNDFYGAGIFSNPFDNYNFYEPRVKDELKYVTIPKNIGTYFYYSSNYNNKFAFDTDNFINFFDQKARNFVSLLFSPRYRFNDKMALIYSTQYERGLNDIGRVAEADNGDIIFARRKTSALTNTLQGKYSLNNVMNLNLAIRHYWSYSFNKAYYTLQDNGDIKENTTYTKDLNFNYSSWNLDFSYSWWFAPASQISILYRETAVNDLSELDPNFDRNFGRNFINNINHKQLNHTLSFSIRYFIDYNNVKHIL
jgi:Domain of unknown function (DUF5916)